jgi:hypothetical protein
MLPLRTVDFKPKCTRGVKMMLARPEKHRCIECGMPFGSVAFWYHQGNIDNGPAYWSDRGILCSPACSLAHHRKRAAEGTLPDHPAPDPFDIDPIRSLREERN